MKKLTLLALAAMTLSPAASFAESWQKEVTNAAEFKTAFNAVGAGAAGETYEIICNWEAGDLQSVGKLKPVMTKGKLVIRSNQKDFEKMPQLELAFEWNADASDADVTKRMSLIFENMNLVGNGSYLVDNRRNMFADTIALRRCDIHGQLRSILRFDGDKSATDPALTPEDMKIDVIEVKECMIHETAQAQGDNWSAFRTFMPVNTFTLTDNMFYNMPYTKSLWETRSPGDVSSVVTFCNNLVLLGENKAISSGGFTALMAGDKLAAGSQFYLYNNIFAGPEEGYVILKNDTSFYKNTSITNVANAIVMAQNNIVDVNTYKSLEDLTATLLESNTTLVDAGGNKTLADYPDFSWATGKTFQDASKNMYYIHSANPWKTAGYDYATGGTGVYHIGPSIAYVDQFPTPAAVNVTINGPEYITYTVTPEKSQYYVGDEITVTLDPQTSMYLSALNEFKGWADGSMDLSRSFTLEGDLDLTANFTGMDNVVSAFTLKQITKNGKPETYDADIYLYMDKSYQSTVRAIINDTTEATGTLVAPFKYINGTFESRPAKFGEDDEELQMPILSRRTWSGAKAYQRNYALFTIPTKGLKDISFSCYVGTDNNAAKVQAIEFSADSVTWSRISEGEIENGVWKQLKATLPSDANDKEKVYVRVIGDMKSGAVVTPDEGVGMWDGEKIVEEVYNSIDAFEYLGSILITADVSGATNGIADVTDSKEGFNENAPVYNMMGMKVAKGTKGLLIQNGKKYIVK